MRRLVGRVAGYAGSRGRCNSDMRSRIGNRSRNRQSKSSKRASRNAHERRALGRNGKPNRCVFRLSRQSRGAISAIADHLRRFWEPRLRVAIGRYLATGGAELLDEVAEAVRRLAPLRQASAAHNETGTVTRRNASG